MSSWLWASALLMGLAGGPHCVAMCGGACSAVAMRCGPAWPARALAAWQLGRLLAYSVAGAVVASSVSVLGQWGRELAWLRPWWVMLHLAAFALGLWMLWQGRAPRWMAGALRLPVWTTSPAAPAARRAAPTLAFAGPGAGSAGLPAVVSAATPEGSTAPTPGPRAAHSTASPVAQPVRWAHAGAAGLVWVAMPCGLLQSALVVAALGSHAAEGAWVMASFAIGSGLSLWLGPRLWTALAGAARVGGWAGRLGPVQAVRLAGALLAVASGWAIVHQMLMPVVDAFCA